MTGRHVLPDVHERRQRPDGDGDPATVSGFRLDKYEVTVGSLPSVRGGVDGRAGCRATAGSGKHTHLNGGRASRTPRSRAYETGWDCDRLEQHDGSSIRPTRTLPCSTTYDLRGLRRATGGQREPADQLRELVRGVRVLHLGRGLLAERGGVGVRGGGGAEPPSGQREYPWGSTSPGTGCQYAIYSCNYPDGRGSCTGVANIAPVGTATMGAGRGASSIWRASSGSGTSTGRRPTSIRAPIAPISQPPRRTAGRCGAATSAPARRTCCPRTAVRNPGDPPRRHRVPVRQDSVAKINDDDVLGVRWHEPLILDPRTLHFFSVDGHSRQSRSHPSSVDACSSERRSPFTHGRCDESNRRSRSSRRDASQSMTQLMIQTSFPLSLVSQSQMMSSVPFAESNPGTFKHLPECGFLSKPSDARSHT